MQLAQRPTSRRCMFQLLRSLLVSIRSCAYQISLDQVSLSAQIWLLACSNIGRSCSKACPAIALSADQRQAYRTSAQHLIHAVCHKSLARQVIAAHTCGCCSAQRMHLCALADRCEQAVAGSRRPAHRAHQGLLTLCTQSSVSQYAKGCAACPCVAISSMTRPHT